MEAFTSSSPGSLQGLADIQNGRHGAKGACLDKDLRLACPAWGRSPSFIEWMTGTHDGMIGLNHLWAGGAYRPSDPRPPAAATAASDTSTSISPKPQHWSKTLCICEGRPGCAHPGGGPGGKRSSSLVIADAAETGRVLRPCGVLAQNTLIIQGALGGRQLITWPRPSRSTARHRPDSSRPYQMVGW